MKKLFKIINKFNEMISKNENLKKYHVDSQISNIKQFEKKGLGEQISTTFQPLSVQQRYENILTALKYTKHSKRREELLRAKRLHETLNN